MTRAKISFATLPLFANDRDIARAVVGDDIEKVERLLSNLPRLETVGFPKPMPGYGRYTPAVKDFYDRMHLMGTQVVTTPVKREDGPWLVKRRKATSV